VVAQGAPTVQPGARGGRVVPGQGRQQRLCRRVVGLARERELQVVLDVVVARVDPRLVGQLRELIDEVV